jgi:hypothetical protein
MQNIRVLYSFNQQKLKNHHTRLFDSDHLNNQLKSSIAELCILKNEILLYQQIYLNIKLSLDDEFLRSKKTGTRLSDA